MPTTNFFDRTLHRLAGAWREVSRSERRPLAERISADVSDQDLDIIRDGIDECLSAKGGKVSARARAADLGRAYLSMSEVGRLRFMTLLANEYGTDHEAVDGAIKGISDDKPEERRAAEMRLLEALRPPYIDLLKQFNGLPEGVKFLVDLRSELLGWAKNEPDLAFLEIDLKRLLAAWFDVGLLSLSRITWRSPAKLLERLIEYEAVHHIRSWTDLKNRLDSDRRCFAFFHPSMPDEPLIFVEVALVNGMADNIQDLLDEAAPAIDPRTADAAIFYSISNAQKGLAGISFGEFLIKRVVDELGREFPNLSTFATLSPIPGLRRWLRQCLPDIDETIVPRESATALAELLDQDWPMNPAQAEELRAPLLRLGAEYLLNSRRNGRAADPVEHFHLTNGARLERLNWLGDSSSKGLKESAGLMVNYLYNLKDIEQNHAAYYELSNVIASSQVRGLLKA